MENQIKTKSKLILFIKDKLIIICIILSFLLNAVIWIILYYKIKPTAIPIPLHYNIYFGIDLIGEWYKIYFIPGFGLIIFFINLIISFIIYKTEKIISYFLIFASMFSQLILLGAVLLIIQQSI